MATIKGIKKLYVSKILSEDEGTGAVTYDKMRYLAGLREITVKPNSESGEMYAENQLWEQDEQFSKVEVSIDVADLSAEDYMYVTGARAAEGGGFLDGGTDTAPYLAIHYEKVLTGGVMEYATLFKGKLAKPEDKAKTAEGKPDYQSKSIGGTFQALKDDKENWRHVVRSNDAGFVQSTFNNTWGAGKTYTVPTEKVGI